MKNIILTLALLLTSCTRVYQEVWVVENYPIEWDEEIIVEGDHQHFEDDDCEWRCLYYERDTICWHHYDTISVKVLEKRERIK